MDSAKVRLDKWLWAARFFKTRGLAQTAIDGGKVHYQGQRCKTSKEVQAGALLQLSLPQGEIEIQVLGLALQRRGAAEAQLLYQETSSSLAKRQQQQLARTAEPQSQGRPSKKDRRELLALKHRQID